MAFSRGMGRLGRPLSTQQWRMSGEEQRNFNLGVINGALFTTGMAFLSASTVVPAFVNTLTDSGLAVGVAAAIQVAGWPLPQLFVARYMSQHTRAIGFYRVGGALRSCFGLLIAVVAALLARDYPGPALAMFLLSLAGFSFMGGVSGIAFTEVVARVIPAGRRSTFFSRRMLLAGFGSLGAGWVVKRILASPLFLFPLNYAAIFACGWLITSVAIFAFANVKEPEIPVKGRREPFWQYVSSGVKLLRQDSGYVRYLVVLALAASHQMAIPFYSVFLLRQVGSSGDSLLGWLIGAQVVGGTLSNLVWGRLGDSRGGRAVLRVSMVITALVPATALWAGKVLAEDGTGYFSSPVFWGGLVFAVLGVAVNGNGVAGITYLLDISPAKHRTVYVGFTNTFQGFFGLFPIVGGLVATGLGDTALFSVALLLQAGAFIAAWRLPRAAREIPDD